MVYKTKVITLSLTVLILALIYTGSILFSPERIGARSAAYAWIDEKALAQADRLEINGSGGETAMSKVNGAWVISQEGNDYPVKQERVEDFLKLLSQKKAYPIRAQTEASYKALGVEEDAAGRIVIRGGPGLPGAEKPPLLDLLVGSSDATGQEVYLRKNGGKETRSGDNALNSYVNSSLNSWLNLLLLGDRKLNAGAVQRVTVSPPPPEGESPAEEGAGGYTLTRAGEGWTLQGKEEALDSQKVESYVRAILEAEAGNFNTGLRAAEMSEEGRIVLDLGDGSSRTIRVGPKGEGNKRDAAVSGSSFVYSLADWTVNRLFRDPAEFAKN